MKIFTQGENPELHIPSSASNSSFLVIIQVDCLAATALQLLLKLKRHLKTVYSLNDSRCQVKIVYIWFLSLLCPTAWCVCLDHVSLILHDISARLFLQLNPQSQESLSRGRTFPLTSITHAPVCHPSIKIWFRDIR
jgi:hypothetical protein